LGISLLHSMVKTLWQGGVHWRDTFYPLAMLREGCLDWSPLKRLTPPDLNSRETSQQWNDAPNDRPTSHPVSN